MSMWTTCTLTGLNTNEGETYFRRVMWSMNIKLKVIIDYMKAFDTVNYNYLL